MAFRIYTGAGGRRFVGEVGQGEIVESISKRSGVPINSNARDQAAAAQLHSIGLHTQAEVIQLHARGVPGFGPANPVNMTTHCRFNDGVAYRQFGRGARLPLRGRGVDTANTPAFLRQAHRDGYAFYLTYPGAVGERQHVNEASSTWGRRPGPPTIKRGARGRHAKRLIGMLLSMGYLGRDYPRKERSHFGARVEQSVKVFQRRHHLDADGVVGTFTWAQLEAAFSRHERAPKPPPKPPAKDPSPTPPKPPAPKPPPRPIPHQLHKGPVNGADVSEHNGDIDWRKYAVGANEFAWVRIADGDHHDRLYTKARVDSMRKNRVIFGPYYYARVASPGNRERNGAAECDMAIQLARVAGWGKPGDLHLAYDFEEANGQTLAKAGRHLVQFVARYHARMGEWPELYSSPAFLAAVVATLSPQGRTIVGKCPLWIAHVGVGGSPRTSKPTVPKPWKDYTFWQFSWKSRPAGVSGDCDMSVFRGSFTKLLALTIRR